MRPTDRLAQVILDLLTPAGLLGFATPIIAVTLFRRWRTR